MSCGGCERDGVCLNVPLYSSEQSLPVIDLLCRAVGKENQDQAHDALAQADCRAEAETHRSHGGVDVGIDHRNLIPEPILMVIMAGLIGVVVGGTLLPIYSLVNSVAA